MWTKTLFVSTLFVALSAAQYKQPQYSSQQQQYNPQYAPQQNTQQYAPQQYPPQYAPQPQYAPAPVQKKKSFDLFDAPKNVVKGELSVVGTLLSVPAGVIGKITGLVKPKSKVAPAPMYQQPQYAPPPQYQPQYQPQQYQQQYRPSQ